jgi:hypothetical protein
LAHRGAPCVPDPVPGNYTAATQPFPTLPEPVDGIVTDGLTQEYIIDYTPN